MQSQDIALCTAKRLTADVVPPQLATDASLHCQYRPQSAKVCAGRTQAVCSLKRGLRGKIAPTLQEYWSRGCRRAHALYSHYVWLPLWQHALRKKKKLYLLKSRCLSSRPIPANTSNILQRAGRGNPVWRAAVSGTLGASAPAPHSLLNHTAAVSFIQDRSPC